MFGPYRNRDQTSVHNRTWEMDWLGPIRKRKPFVCLKCLIMKRVSSINNTSEANANLFLSTPHTSEADMKCHERLFLDYQFASPNIYLSQTFTKQCHAFDYLWFNTSSELNSILNPLSDTSSLFSKPTHLSFATQKIFLCTASCTSNINLNKQVNSCLQNNSQILKSLLKNYTFWGKRRNHSSRTEFKSPLVQPAE